MFRKNLEKGKSSNIFLDLFQSNEGRNNLLALFRLGTLKERQRDFQSLNIKKRSQTERHIFNFGKIDNSCYFGDGSESSHFFV